jgi:hypothetical protein
MELITWYNTFISAISRYLNWVWKDAEMIFKSTGYPMPYHRGQKFSYSRVPHPFSYRGPHAKSRYFRGPPPQNYLNSKTPNAQTVRSSQTKTIKNKVVPVYIMQAYGGSRCTAPLILKIGSRRRWVVKSHAPATIHPGKEPQYLLNNRLDGVAATVWTLSRKEKYVPLLGFEPLTVQPVA